MCTAHVEVREQLLGVGSPLPPQVPGVELRLSDRVASFPPSEPALYVDAVMATEVLIFVQKIIFLPSSPSPPSF